MADTKERVEHCLALKVMRLTRPTVGSSVIVQSEEKDVTKWVMLLVLLSENVWLFFQTLLVIFSPFTVSKNMPK